MGIFCTKNIHGFLVGSSVIGLVVLLTACSNAEISQPAPDEGRPVSSTWTRFSKEKKENGASWLPDFSYAGYKRGEASPQLPSRRFNVTDYGAQPDDLKDDYDGITAAIKAAEKNGGGVVFMPRGRYLMNTSMDRRRTLSIRSNNIVLKGEGAGKGGTIIHSIHPYGGGNPQDSRRLHLGRNLLQLWSKPETVHYLSRQPLCRVAADSPRETFALTVDAPGKLQAGDWVCLQVRSRRIMDEMVAPYAIDPKWTTICDNKADLIEYHQIKSVSGNKLEFYEPLRYDIKAGDGWKVLPYQPISQVGVEDICFMGNAYQQFKHHRSGYDDSGWSMIKFRGVVDGWVRRCSFINCSQTIYVSRSARVSVMNIVVAGNMGHHIPRFVSDNNGILGLYIDDRAGYFHGPSISQGTIASVFSECRSKGSIDCHAGFPYANLFENVTGGRINSTGGRRDYPQHLRFLLIWNFKHDVDELIRYDFWQKGKNNCFVKPIIVGWHGARTEFNQEHVGCLESYGQPVAPSSLYRAQLRLRLGTSPEWLSQAASDHAAEEKMALPAYFSRSDRKTSLFVYPEKFKVEDMLTYLTSLSLQMYNSKQFTFKVDQPDLQMFCDQGLVRNALYSLMNCIYAQCKSGNWIEASRGEGQNSHMVRFVLHSGKTVSNAEGKDVHWQDAERYAAILGGRISQLDDQRLELVLPCGI